MTGAAARSSTMRGSPAAMACCKAFSSSIAPAPATLPSIARTVHGGESIRDVVMHITDAELVRAASLRFVMALENPVVPDWDETLFKRKLHYLFRDPELALTVFQTVRFCNAELLQQLDAQSWQRAGTRASDGSTTTLAELMVRAVEHDANHIAQIEVMRDVLGMGLGTAG